MKRKNAFVLLVSLLLLICVPLTATADEILQYGFVLAFDASKTEVEAGEEFTVGITMGQITEKNGFIGIDADVYYDSNLLSAVSMEPVFPENWNGLGANMSPDSCQLKEDGTEEGLWRIHLVYDGEVIGVGVKEDGKFGMTFKFKAKEGASGEARVYVNTDDMLSAPSDQDPDNSQLGLKATAGKGGEVKIKVGSGATIAPSSSGTDASGTASQPSGSTGTSGTNAIGTTAPNGVDDKESNTVLFLCIGVGVVLVGVAVFAVVKTKKGNKSDKDNPVNPN